MLCYSTLIKMKNTFILPLLIIMLIIASLLPSTFCSVDDDSTDALEKSNLIVATYKNPLGKFPKTRNTQAGLYEVECLDLLKDAFQFTYDIKTCCLREDNIMSGEYGSEMKNGSWTGVMGMVQRQEVDMCISASPISEEKNRVMDSSYPITFDETSILMPYPKESDKIAVLAKPFTSQVWVCFLMFSLFTPICLWIANRFNKSITNDVKSLETLNKFVFLFIEMMASKSAVHRSKLLSYRFICGSVLLASVILGNIYSGIYTSILTVPHFNVAIKSIEDVAANPNIKVHVFKNTPTENYIETSDDNSAVKMIQDQLRRNPSQKIPFQNYTGDISLIIKDDRVLLNGHSYNEVMMMDSYERNNKTCKVTLAEKTFYSRKESIAYPKNSPLTKPIDQKLLLFHQFGLLDYANKRALQKLTGKNNKNPCLIMTKKMNPLGSNEATDLRSFSGAFLVLGIGSVLAFIAWITERVLHKFI